MSKDYIDTLPVPKEARERLGAHCACITVEEGWRPCPSQLCERDDHDHAPRRKELPWTP